MGLDCYKWRPYNVRSLVSNPIYAKKDRNGPPKLLLHTSPYAAMLLPTFTYPALLLKQNLSPKNIAGSDIMKLKVLSRL